MTTVPRRFDRDDLERFSHGSASELFGPLYAIQDGRTRQTRLPKPPLLLLDEITNIDGEPAAMGTGAIQARTFMHPDRSYLDHTGRMHPGLAIETTQSLLVLLSWLGADLRNSEQKVFRMLEYEATFHGSGVPAVGEILDSQTRIVDLVQHDQSLLAFIEADCKVAGEQRLTVRNAQAGYFSYDELDAARGVPWDPRHTDEPAGHADPPAATPRARSFGSSEVRAFADGRAAHCFGPHWQASGSPRLPSGEMLLLGEITDYDPHGGPWSRGYLRAETPVHPDDWFFAAHFHNDPVMPGNLILDGCLQAMGFYLAASGFTIGKNGWHFEPVPNHPFTVRCRGQLTPAADRAVYEVFVTQLTAHPRPTLIADVLFTVKGLRAQHVQNLSQRLAPSY